MAKWYQLCQMVSIQAVLSSTYVSQNATKSMTSLASQSCVDSLLTVCWYSQDVVIYRPPVDVR